MTGYGNVLIPFRFHENMPVCVLHSRVLKYLVPMVKLCHLCGSIPKADLAHSVITAQALMSQHRQGQCSVVKVTNFGRYLKLEILLELRIYCLTLYTGLLFLIRPVRYRKYNLYIGICNVKRIYTCRMITFRVMYDISIGIGIELYNPVFLNYIT